MVSRRRANGRSRRALGSGRTRDPDATAVQASWGSGTECARAADARRNQATIGPPRSTLRRTAPWSCSIRSIAVSRRIARDGAAPRYSDDSRSAGARGTSRRGRRRHLRPRLRGERSRRSRLRARQLIRLRPSPSPLAGADMVRSRPGGGLRPRFPGRRLATRDPARRSAVCGGPGRGSIRRTIAGRWSADRRPWLGVLRALRARPGRSRARRVAGYQRHAARGDPARGAVR